MLQPAVRLLGTICLLGWILAAQLPANEAEPAAAPTPDGDLTQLVVEAGQPGLACVLSGRDARRQLIVTGGYASGAQRDLTREATYEIVPAGIAEVDTSGLVTPLADGHAVITASASNGAKASIEVLVEGTVQQQPINFPNQITPLFTKFGCNGGGCHGKASGQNGFKLSLLGFEPSEDYEYLVKEGRGRRLFPAAPDLSLLLQKGTNTVPHGGGQRLTKDSHEYRLMRRWIEQGMPYGKPEDPKVARIEVYPATRSMQRQTEQQLVVLAHYTDGSVEDVTRTATFDANDTEMAEASPTGVVHVLDLAGEVAIMARYQGQVGVFRASIPLGAATPSAPPAKNFIDELVFAKLGTLGIPASAPCDDSTFLRRVTIDIAGRLPTPAETRAFAADADPAKRERWIDQLLASEDYADYFANKWSAVLRNKRESPEFAHGTFTFHSWLREKLYENLPYDQLVRELVAAAGEPTQNPPVIWYRELKETNQLVEDTAQLFLGMRLQCARCHHHPFEKWSQNDYYSFAAFFSRVGRKAGELPGEQIVFHNRGPASAKHPKSGADLKPAGLGAPPLDLSAERDPRQALADWMAEPTNPFFAPALVNRYWKHFFDRGLVDPEDDMRVTNPASNPELLDALSKRFIESGFDLKGLVRAICQSQTYQLSSEPNEHNLSDKQNYSRYYPKRFTAEVLLDAINQVTSSTTEFPDLPAGARAVQLPDQQANSYFLTVFGRPQADTACECERSQEANLAQSLHLLNSPEIQGKLTSSAGRAALLAGDATRSDEEKMRELYLWVYSREPNAEELQVALTHLAKNENKQLAYEDIVWALINTKEFLFTH